MKIASIIKPRADGSVVFVHKGREYRFIREASGILACDVDEKDAVRAMLATDRFYPLQAADEPLAQKIVQEAKPQAAPQTAPRRSARRSKKDEAAA